MGISLPLSLENKMPKIAYIEKRFSKGSLEIIDQANEIIAEYRSEGLSLTLRQLYYQFVSRDLLANKQSEYKRLGVIISDGRLAGKIDWLAIEDRTRDLKRNYYNTDPGQAIQDALDQFLLDKWDNQPYHPEVWIEKEALTGVIAGICSELDVPYFACKGYNSQSEMWRAAMRMKRAKADGKIPIIIHLGDHDPSGMDMTRDIDDRYELFTGNVQVERIALTYEQIKQYNPPPNPTKSTDTRAKNYDYEASWELDALEPRVIRDLIRDTVNSFIDQDLWDETLEKEKEYRGIMQNIVENWRSL